MDYDLLIKKLNKYKKMNLEDINIDNLIEISNIKITRKKSSKQRILDFLNEIDNPYFFKVNGRIVQIAFNDESSLSANDCLYGVLKDIYK